MEVSVNQYLDSNTSIDLPYDKRKKVDLSLSGGGIHGIAHIGVLKYLAERGYELGDIVGVSAGAIVGSICSYYKKRGLYLYEIVDECIEILEKNNGFGNIKDSNLLRFLFGFVSFNPRTFGIYKGHALADFIYGIIGDLTFEDFPYFRCVATHMHSGGSIIFSQDTTPTVPVWKAVRASASVQGLFRPTAFKFNDIYPYVKDNWNDPYVYDLWSWCIQSNIEYSGMDMFFWDGANSGNARYDLLSNSHPDRLKVVVDLSIEPSHRKMKSPFDIISQTVAIMVDKQNDLLFMKAIENNPDLILIKPSGFEVSFTDFDIEMATINGLIKIGYEAAKARLESVEK